MLPLRSSSGSLPGSSRRRNRSQNGPKAAAAERSRKVTERSRAKLAKCEDRLSDLQELAELHAAGIVTDDEFAASLGLVCERRLPGFKTYLRLAGENDRMVEPMPRVSPEVEELAAELRRLWPRAAPTYGAMQHRFMESFRVAEAMVAEIESGERD